MQNGAQLLKMSGQFEGNKVGGHQLVPFSIVHDNSYIIL